ncbi:hypothetical protein JCM3770_005234 [Rhodotorula araucariae]
MPSLLRRLRSTTVLRARLDTLTAPEASAQPPSPRTQRGFSPPPSPTRLRATPKRRGYQGLKDEGGALRRDEAASGPGESDIFCWTLDEGDSGGELGLWEWVDRMPADAHCEGGDHEHPAALKGFRFPYPAPSPPQTATQDAPSNLVVPASPPTVPLALPAVPHQARLTPIKRKASVSYPSTSSPTSSLSSALLHASPTGTSISSLSATPGSGNSASSISLSLTIATRLDSNGHRVLTSRRRQSLQPSPHKARRNKGAFGIGNEASDDERDTGGDDARLGKVHAPFDAAGAGTLPEPTGAGLGLIDLGPLVHAPEPIPTPPSRPRLEAIRPPSLAAAALAHEPEQLSLPPSPLGPPLSEHQPIKTFTPPPPLYPSSPTKSSAFATLTRSNTMYSTSSASSSPSKRRQSLQPRKSLSRLTLARASVSYGPPMTATFARSHSRRASSPVIQPLGALERHASDSSSAGKLSVPPTPGETSASSHFSLATAGTCATTSEPLLRRAGSAGATSARRTSQVSFELPPASPSEVVNPDLTPTLPSSESSSTPRSSPPDTPTPSRLSRPTRPPKSLARRSLPTGTFAPPSPPPLSHQVGIAC